MAVLAVVTSAAPADEPTSEPRDYVTLASELASDDWATRKAAAEAIVRRGRSVLPRIEATLQQTSKDEVNSDLTLVAEAVRESAHTSSSAVSVRSESVADVIASLNAANGMRLTRGSGLTSDVNVDRHGPFWHVVAQLCRDHDWDIAVSAGGSRNLQMALVAANGERQLAGPMSVSGPAAVIVRAVRHLREVDFTAALPSIDAPASVADDHSLRVELEALLEPRYQIGLREFRVVWDEATNEQGVDLLPPGRSSETPHETVAIWSAGRLRLGVDLDGQATGETFGIAGTISGAVGGDMYHATLAPEATHQEWMIAGEPVAVTIVRGEDLTGSRGRRARWQFQATLRSTPDRTTQHLVSTALTGLLLENDAGRLTRGSTRIDFADPMGPQIEIDFVARAEDGEEHP
ncbi:MAG: hypothetical protein AAF561_05265, partial [Planctomycetota bacterium]